MNNNTLPFRATQRHAYLLLDNLYYFWQILTGPLWSVGKPAVFAHFWSLWAIFGLTPAIECGPQSKKHRKNCECCPGHSFVSVSVCVSVSVSQKSLKSLSKVSQKSLKSLSIVVIVIVKNQKSLTDGVTRSPIELSWTARNG